MKISKIFHSLYFMVMFLPLFIIPIFAININQKSVEPISITVYEHKISKKYETNEVNSASDLIKGNIYKFTFDYSVFTSNTGFLSVYGIYSVNDSIQKVTSSDETIHLTYLVANDLILTSQNGYQTSFYNVSNMPYIYVVYDQILNNNITFQNFSISDFTDEVYGYDQMVVYDNTDIGSQFIYSLYKPVHDYFNFGQYFGLNGVYDWFQINWFNGTAPLTFFIFYNLMIYWLIISLLWLLFDVLIYVPLLIHRWLDKAAIE